MEKTILALGIVLLLGATLYLSQDTNNDEMIQLFQKWKGKYNKKYTTTEEMYRFKVFLENVAYIKAHYESPVEHRYTLAINQFADLTDAEFANTYLNLQVPKNHKLREVNEDYTVKGSSDLSGNCNGVKNQGACGSCWAFSAVAALECNTKIESGNTVTLSEQDLVDCSGTYGNQGCNGGWMDSAFDYVRDNGVANGSSYPYTAQDGKCQAVERSFRISGYQDLYSCDALADAALKRTVSVAVDASNWKFYTGGQFDNCVKNLNHGVLVVGVNEDGAWKVRNSWGAAWGESGYINLAPGDTCGVCQAPSYPIF